MKTVNGSKSRFKPATKPVSGSCKWELKPDLANWTASVGAGVLSIRTEGNDPTSYMVSPIVDNATTFTGELLGYQLAKLDGNGEVYDLPADLSTCDCPDATFHPERFSKGFGGCKHAKTLRNALTVLGVVVPSPKPAYRSLADMKRNAPEVYETQSFEAEFA